MWLKHPLGPHQDVLQVAGGAVRKYDVLMIGEGETAEFVWVDGTPLGDYVHVRRDVSRYFRSLTPGKVHPREARVVLAGMAEEERPWWGS